MICNSSLNCVVEKEMVDTEAPKQKKGMFDFLKKKDKEEVPKAETTSPKPSVNDPTPEPGKRKHSMATSSAASKTISIKRNGKLATVDIIKLRRLLLEADAEDEVSTCLTQEINRQT